MSFAPVTLDFPVAPGTPPRLVIANAGNFIRVNRSLLDMRISPVDRSRGLRVASRLVNVGAHSITYEFRAEWMTDKGCAK